MKTTLTQLIVLLLLLAPTPALVAQTEFTTDDPGTYVKYIVDEQEKIGQEFIDFSTVLVNSQDPKVKDAKRQDVLKEIELSLRRLRNLAPFEENAELRDKSVSVFSFYRKLHIEQYAKIVVMMTNRGSSLKQLEEYFKLQAEVEKELKQQGLELRAAQEKFAKEHNLLLYENGKQDQFDRILEANIYSREVYVKYLPVAQVNEAWLLALKANDYPAMEKQRTALIAAVEADPFAGDKGLNGYTGFRDAALELITWYGALAHNEYKRVHGVLTNPQRTKEDVDFVNGFITSFNARNTELNEDYNAAARELKKRALPATSGSN
ncbi:MAG: hypothetical protein AAGN35_22410 [Bacteroidota bacterium]